MNENFPGSAQTQVTGIDDKGNTSGFWVTAGGTNHGFIEWNGVFASYNDPNTPKVKGSVNQLLGISNAGIAVGFYNDKNGNSHASKVNQATGQNTAIHVPGVSTAATGTPGQQGAGAPNWPPSAAGRPPASCPAPPGPRPCSPRRDA